MKKIVINSDNRRFNISSIVVGYLDENKTEKIEFIIPDKYKEFGKKACFNANGKIFAKMFDDINGSTLTFTRDITKYKELEMSIEFFKIENKDEIIARTSNLHITIENVVICNDDISPDEPKIIILDKLIEEVTKVGLEVGEKGNYAKEQGDYAKSQAENVISANTEAIKIINNFENNVEAYTTAFNENANNKTTDFDSNAESKTSDFNQNVDNKISEYNNNASEKLSAYNTNASAKLQEYNDNATQKIAEYDEHSQELDNKIIDTRNELERVKNDVLETGTDTDTYIHLEDSAMAEYQELSVDGVCEQNTYAGYQLLNISDHTVTSHGVTTTTKDNKTNCSGTIDTNWANISASNAITCNLKANKTYTFVLNKTLSYELDFKYNDIDIRIPGGSIYKTYTPTAEKTRLYYFIQAKEGTSINITDLQIMIYEGEYDENKTFEPYTGGQPSPSPSYPQPISTIENSLKITSYNKNLWNVDNIEIGAINENGVFVSSDVRARAYYQKIQNNDRITISSGISGLSVVPYFYDKNKKFISYNDGWKTMPYTFDIVKDAKYVAFLFKNSSNTINLDELTQIQLEQNSTATEYEQHLETQITANLPEGEFIGKINDTYKDTLKVEYNETDGQYHLKLYKRVYKNVSYNNENYDYYISTTARNDGIINCGKLQTGQVVYYLGDETIIDLGVVDQLLSYDKVSNIFTNSDLLPQINAKYYRNFITTIQNLQVNEKALKQELIDINARLSALETASASVVSESEVVE